MSVATATADGRRPRQVSPVRVVNRGSGAPGPDGSSCCISRNMSSIPVATRAAKRDIRRMHEHGLHNLRRRAAKFEDEKKSGRESVLQV